MRTDERKRKTEGNNIHDGDSAGEMNTWKNTAEEKRRTDQRRKEDIGGEQQ